jgi:hypothetical protein
VGVFGLRASHHFSDGSLTHENAERPLTAKEGVAYFKEQDLQWRSHIERLNEEGLARPVGEPEAYLDAPMASLVLHVNREALHHLAEVSCCGTSTGRLGRAARLMPLWPDRADKRKGTSARWRTSRTSWSTRTGLR